MRHALIALAAGGALAAAALPALAQTYGISQREDNTRDRIAQGVRDGDLSLAQAGRLRSELREIVDLDARYQSDGSMDSRQERDLNSRLSLLSSRLNYDVTMSRDEDGY